MPVTETELQRFLGQRIPRALPPSVRADRLPAMPIVVAVGAVIAVALLALGIALESFPRGILDDVQLDLGETAVAKGEVLGLTATEREISDPDDPMRMLRVYRIDFRFSGTEGEPATGSSYSRAEPPPPGTSVEVQYLLAEPSIARVQGTSRSASPKRAAIDQ